MAEGTRDGDSGEARHAATARLLWGPQPQPARGPRRTLDLARIARAGVAVADAEGLAAVSMQRVASQLDVTKMALYRYVPGKAELVALMVDAALAPLPPEDEPRPDWRGQLAAWAQHLLHGFGRHPWLLDATVGPRMMGPVELAWLERAVAALDGTPLTGAERLDAAVLLTGHVRTLAQQGAAAGPGGGAEAQLHAVLGGVLRDHGDRFPAVTTAFHAAATAPAAARDQAWEFGLHRILDGLETLIAERS
ncbi:TetR/AcrR family transcriptional regulator [Streptomyces niger]|uniref:TetR/AcrR family transcriptional regulator n=1 Tax=Streptomyces niger TaxID=66373 RepID=UPI0006999834|nr:TetR/AcrR family transcriptional regulator [Streptomyces niger]